MGKSSGEGERGGVVMKVCLGWSQGPSGLEGRGGSSLGRTVEEEDTGDQASPLQ